jgi:hypothetical protein
MEPEEDGDEDGSYITWNCPTCGDMDDSEYEEFLQQQKLQSLEDVHNDEDENISKW